MSNLIDKLREAGRVLQDTAPSHVPSLNEIPGVLGALSLLIEHGSIEAGLKAIAPAVEQAVEAVAPGAAPVVQEAERIAADAEPVIQAVERSTSDDKLDALLQAVNGLAGVIAAGQHPTVSVRSDPAPAAPAEVKPGFYPGVGE